jgi:hypothetical protein
LLRSAGFAALASPTRGRNAARAAARVIDLSRAPRRSVLRCTSDKTETKKQNAWLHRRRRIVSSRF